MANGNNKPHRTRTAPAQLNPTPCPTRTEPPIDPREPCRKPSRTDPPKRTPSKKEPGHNNPTSHPLLVEESVSQDKKNRVFGISGGEAGRSGSTQGGEVP
eukprot:scaffold52988_cov68-Phaeocystis_antarctica.AAC.19